MDIKEAVEYKNKFIGEMVKKYKVNETDDNIQDFEIALDNDDKLNEADIVIYSAAQEVINIQKTIDSGLYTNTSALQKQINDIKNILKGAIYG